MRRYAIIFAILFLEGCGLMTNPALLDAYKDRIYRILIAEPNWEYVNYASPECGTKVKGSGLSWPLDELTDGRKENALHPAVLEVFKRASGEWGSRDNAWRNMMERRIMGFGYNAGDPIAEVTGQNRYYGYYYGYAPSVWRTWIEFEFPEPKLINKVIIYSAQFTDIIAVRRCRLLYWDEKEITGPAWKLLGSRYMIKSRVIPFDFPSVRTRKIRIELPDEYAEVNEVEIFGEEIVMKDRLQERSRK